MKCSFRGGTDIPNNDKQRLNLITGKIRKWRKQGYNVDELENHMKINQKKKSR